MSKVESSSCPVYTLVTLLSCELHGRWRHIVLRTTCMGGGGVVGYKQTYIMWVATQWEFPFNMHQFHYMHTC